MAVSFREAKVLLEHLSIDDLLKDEGALVIDVRGFRQQAYTPEGGYLQLHRATMRMPDGGFQLPAPSGYVVKTGRLRLRCFESTWLCDEVARRIEPL